MKKKIMFVCTGNSNRSQIAEHLARKHYSDIYEPISGGTRPSGYVHPLAERFIREDGGDMTHHSSKHIVANQGQDIHHTVTLCDSAAIDGMQDWSKYAGHTEHWPIADSSHAPGENEDKKYERFKQEAHEIKRRLDSHAKEFGK